MMILGIILGILALVGIVFCVVEMKNSPIIEDEDEDCANN